MAMSKEQLQRLNINNIGRYILTNDHGVIGTVSSPIKVCRDQGVSSFEISYPDGSKFEAVVAITEI